MIKHVNNTVLMVQCALITGLVIKPAQAQVAYGGARENDFGSIARNITHSIEELPGLLTGVAYLMGITLGVLGIMKIKDHVETPANTPLKDGAIRIGTGGALFALPLVYESMLNTMGVTNVGVAPATLSRAEFNLR